MMENRTWYAVMRDNDDDDWGTGSFELAEAEQMLEQYPQGYIAVIEDGICVDELDKCDWEPYLVVDCAGDVHTDAYDTEAEAVEAASAAWAGLSDYDKARREAFYVLKSVNPRSDASNHLDGEMVAEFF